MIILIARNYGSSEVCSLRQHAWQEAWPKVVLQRRVKLLQVKGPWRTHGLLFYNGYRLVFSFKCHLKSNSERCSTVAVNSKLCCISYQGGSEVWKIQGGSWVILNCFRSGACFIHLQFACAALYYLIDVHVIREDKHWTHKDIFEFFCMCYGNLHGVIV